MSINFRQEVTGVLRRKGDEFRKEAKSLDEMAEAYAGSNREYFRHLKRQGKNTEIRADLCGYLADMIQPRKDK